MGNFIVYPDKCTRAIPKGKELSKHLYSLLLGTVFHTQTSHKPALYPAQPHWPTAAK